MKARFITLSLVSLLTLLALAAGALVVMVQSPVIELETESVVYEVRAGQSLSSVLVDLKSAGWLKDPWRVKLWAYLTGSPTMLRSGEYELVDKWNTRQLWQTLISGTSVLRSFTVPEGYNLLDIAQLLESQGFEAADDFVQLMKDPDFVRQQIGEDVGSLEGYLFPDTYRITKFASAKDVARAMIARFSAQYQEHIAVLKPNWSRHQIVTLASIIEKETGAAHERPLIASVFHNRLQQNKRLETDPTILYGIWDQTGVMKKNITKTDIQTKTRYNTYRINGLPPGPISNPGIAALKAAVQPAQSDYMFFVSRNDGTHVFSKTYKEHLAAVAKFQLDRKMRQGRSWRDLNRARAAN